MTDCYCLTSFCCRPDCHLCSLHCHCCCRCLHRSSLCFAWYSLWWLLSVSWFLQILFLILFILESIVKENLQSPRSKTTYNKTSSRQWPLIKTKNYWSEVSNHCQKRILWIRCLSFYPWCGNELRWVWEGSYSWLLSFGIFYSMSFGNKWEPWVFLLKHGFLPY